MPKIILDNYLYRLYNSKKTQRANPFLFSERTKPYENTQANGAASLSVDGCFLPACRLRHGGRCIRRHRQQVSDGDNSGTASSIWTKTAVTGPPTSDSMRESLIGDRTEIRVLVVSNEIQTTYYSEEIEPDMYPTTDAKLNEAVAERNNLVSEKLGIDVKAVPVDDVASSSAKSCWRRRALSTSRCPRSASARRWRRRIRSTTCATSKRRAFSTCPPRGTTRTPTNRSPSRTAFTSPSATCRSCRRSTPLQ